MTGVRRQRPLNRQVPQAGELSEFSADECWKTDARCIQPRRPLLAGAGARAGRVAYASYWGNVPPPELLSSNTGLTVEAVEAFRDQAPYTLEEPPRVAV